MAMVDRDDGIGDTGQPRVFTPNAIHLVRTATQANLTLSQMADQKASLLMGATFVVFTIAVSQASRGHFAVSLLMLALFAFAAAMLAVAAVIPKVDGPPVSRNPWGPQPVPNLLFFGVFARMREDLFVDAVLDDLVTDETVFRAMLRDIHQNGQVLLTKKYRYLGLAFHTFQIGLGLTFVVFLFESRAMLAGLLAW